MNKSAQIAGIIVAAAAVSLSIYAVYTMEPYTKRLKKIHAPKHSEEDANDAQVLQFVNNILNEVVLEAAKSENSLQTSSSVETLVNYTVDEKTLESKSDAALNNQKQILGKLHEIQNISTKCEVEATEDFEIGESHVENKTETPDADKCPKEADKSYKSEEFDHETLVVKDSCDLILAETEDEKLICNETIRADISIIGSIIDEVIEASTLQINHVQLDADFSTNETTRNYTSNFELNANLKESDAECSYEHLIIEEESLTTSQIEIDNKSQAAKYALNLQIEISEELRKMMEADKAKSEIDTVKLNGSSVEFVADELSLITDEENTNESKITCNENNQQLVIDEQLQRIDMENSQILAHVDLQIFNDENRIVTKTEVEIRPTAVEEDKTSCLEEYQSIEIEKNDVKVKEETQTVNISEEEYEDTRNDNMTQFNIDAEEFQYNIRLDIDAEEFIPMGYQGNLALI